MHRIVQVIQRLSTARTLDGIIEIVRHAARELTGADGATFVLRDENRCFYADEDAIGPLWKGKSFPMDACISGWVMVNRQSAVIEDIYQDPRIPTDAYRPTFVKSLVMVPIRSCEPIGAIGNYWAKPHKATSNEIDLLQSLADSTSIAFENVNLYQSLQKAIVKTQSARDELQKQLTLRDEFISIAAHELKTPLTPLMIQIQFIDRLLMKGQFFGHPNEKELKRLVAVSTKRLREFANFVEVLLDVSRLQLGQFKFNFEENVNLTQLVSTVIEEFQLSSPIQVEARLESEVVGRWDKSKLLQVIRNIFSNAVRYGKGNPIKIETFVKCDHAHLILTDHGIGIAPSDQERIFERFERATSIQNFGGIGLGLYITKKIVEGHQGSIKVESKLEHGSTFIIQLPRNLEIFSNSL